MIETSDGRWQVSRAMVPSTDGRYQSVLQSADGEAVNACTLGGLGERLHYAQAWVLSLLLHGTAISLAILLVADLNLAPQLKPFTWEVSMVEAPAQKPQDDPTQAEPTYTSPAPPKATRHQAQPKPAEAKPVAQTVQTVQAVQRVVRQEIRETKPLLQAIRQSAQQPTQQAPQTIGRTVQVLKTSQQQNLPMQPMSTAATDARPVVRETAVTSPVQSATVVTKEVIEHVTPITSSESAAMSRPVVEATQTSETVQERVVVKEAETKMVKSTDVEQVATASIREAPLIARETSRVSTSHEVTAVTKQVATEAAPITSPAHHRRAETRLFPSSSDATVMDRTAVDATQTSATVQEPVVVKETSTKMVESTVVERAKAAAPTGIEHALAREFPASTTPQTKADFSWLAQALLSRVEQFKRYPHMARMNHWEGRVILRAVILEDGHVLGVEVTESSGHSELDNDALGIVRKASPLKLKHPLGQSQVVVRVPIRYRLEH